MSLISLKLFLFLMLFNVNHSQNIVSTAITKEYDFWMWLSGHRNGDTGGLEKPWVWGSSGTTIGYTAWTEGEPDEAYTSPACMNFSATAGGWEDDLCDLVISFLCEAP
ncbi:hypothetical protein B566_EDAN013755 [Ephemera danica]|nr:hypothetical protein B566_EDAN013755 [Ephemera danica]